MERGFAMADETQNRDLQAGLPLPSLTPPPPRSILYRIFVGPRGVRAGWKDVIFFLLFGLTLFALHPLTKVHGKVNPKEPMPAGVAFLDESIGALAVVTATALMAKWIDRKPWGYFGMPIRKAFHSSFWVGSAVGLGALSLQLEIMHLAGWQNFGRIELHGAAVLQYGLIWGVMFFLVGVTEEGLLRGYVQRVTTHGLSALRGGRSFWTSALIFSLMFGAGHLSNPGENKFGVFMVFVDGMTMCFSLWRTGDLWFAIGNHAAWDWGQTFLFGTPDSGFIGQHPLMTSSFHGPLLLSGGADGPEGSVLVLLSEAIFLIAIAVIYRRRKYPLPMDEATEPKPD